MASLRELLKQTETAQITEACKKKKPGTKKVIKLKESTDLTIQSLESILELVQTGSLSTEETKNIQESIEAIFNNVLNEEYDEDEEYEDSDEEYEDSDEEYEDSDEEYEDSDEEYEDSDEEYEDSDEDEEYMPELVCTNPDCDWQGDFTDLEDGEDIVCPACGSTLEKAVYDEEYSDEEDDEEYSGEEGEEEYSEEDELEESMLGKTSAADKKDSKMYKKTAAGKKSYKISAKKRKKYTTQISRCSENGKTFSFKTMGCVKPKTRR